jgi:hypothetical protein
MGAALTRFPIPLRRGQPGRALALCVPCVALARWRRRPSNAAAWGALAGCFPPGRARAGGGRCRGPIQSPRVCRIMLRTLGFVPVARSRVGRHLSENPPGSSDEPRLRNKRVGPPYALADRLGGCALAYCSRAGTLHAPHARVVVLVIPVGNVRSPNGRRCKRALYSVPVLGDAYG